MKRKPQVPSSVSLFFFLSCCYFFRVKSISKSLTRSMCCNFTPKKHLRRKKVMFQHELRRHKKSKEHFNTFFKMVLNIIWSWVAVIMTMIINYTNSMENGKDINFAAWDPQVENLLRFLVSWVLKGMIVNFVTNF